MSGILFQDCGEDPSVSWAATVLLTESRLAVWGGPQAGGRARGARGAQRGRQGTGQGEHGSTRGLRPGWSAPVSSFVVAFIVHFLKLDVALLAHGLQLRDSIQFILLAAQRALEKTRQDFPQGHGDLRRLSRK